MQNKCFLFLGTILLALLFASCGGQVQIIEGTDPNATNGSLTTTPLTPSNPAQETAEPLQVISHTPNHADTDIRLDARITITFSTSIDADSASADTLEVYNANNTLLQGNIVVANEKLYFYPQSHFGINTAYTVLVSKYIKSAEGKRLGENYTFSFTTIISTQRPDDAPSIPFE